MEKRMFITISDYERIREVTDDSWKGKNPELIDRLMENLKTAKMIPPANISGNIVTMNSCVMLKNVATGQQADITVTYPHDADNMQRKVSVFSPIGAALLGCQEGDIVSWKVPQGMGKFQIVKIKYQPEAAGDYHL
jgi:regulator of nucleoside diphosphate kinase